MPPDSRCERRMTVGSALRTFPIRTTVAVPVRDADPTSARPQSHGPQCGPYTATAFSAFAGAAVLPYVLARGGTRLVSTGA